MRNKPYRKTHPRRNQAITPANAPGSGHVALWGGFPREATERLALRIDECYRHVDRIRSTEGPLAVEARLGTGHRFVPTASSLNLLAVLGECEHASIMRTLARGSLLPLLRAALGGRLAVDLDQAWVRRQYPPARYPPLHAPHGWHQDGALGFDFLAPGAAVLPQDALLNMFTCWIALTPCGSDAPGLEFVAREIGELLPPAALTDQSLRQRFTADAFSRPVMQAGDVLVFPGGTIHRTHVTQYMQQDRTSLELRFLRADSIPPRLQGDRFVLENL